MNTVTFPGLGLTLHLNRVAFTILGHPVYWYGILIATGFFLAVLYCSHRAKEFGVKSDDFTDLMILGVPMGVVGARLYYVIFYYSLFQNADGSPNFLEMLRIGDGGLAIYGTVIGAVTAAIIFCRVKKLSFFAYADLCSMGLLIGQIVGRWGNFMNVEAHGGTTDLPWRMGIYEKVGGVLQYTEVHPTFLYESLWNLAGLCLLIFLSHKGRRKFDGMLLATYVLWYGFGRGLIEGLRTDSLYLFSTGLRVSQVLGFGSAAVAAIILIVNLKKKHQPEELYVNQLKQKEPKQETEELNNAGDRN